MASISFTCPHCDKVLRTSARLPAGKRIKCPACGEPFAPEFDEEVEATAIQEKPSSTARTSRREAKDDPDARPRKAKAKPVDDDDEDEDDTPRKQKRRPADDEDEDRSIKKKKKKKSGSMMLLTVLLVLLGGGGLLGCAACGIGAFVWPGFLSTQKFEMAQFVAPDADLVIGGNPKLLHAKTTKLANLFPQRGIMGQPNKPLNDVSENCEQMLAFGKVRDAENSIVTILQSNAIDILKVKNNPALGPAQTVAGHANVHRQNGGAGVNGLPRFLAFPGGNIIVSCEQNEQALIAALNRAKQPKQKNAALELGKTVDKALLWMAMIPDAPALADLRNGLDGVVAGAGQFGQPNNLPPSVREAIPALSGIKGITAAMEVNDNSDVKIRAGLACGNADDAGKIKKACDDGFNLVRVGLKAMDDFQPPGQAKLPQAVFADLDAVTFSAQGNDMTANVQLSSVTLQFFSAKAAMGLPFPMPGPGPMGNKGFPPPPPPPMIKKGKKGSPIINNAPPPNGLAKVITWTGNGLGASKQVEKRYRFTAGKTVSVNIEGIVMQNATTFEITVSRGITGENAVPVERGPGDNIRFTVPANDFYRIRIRNTGMNMLNGFTLRITEQ